MEVEEEMMWQSPEQSSMLKAVVGRSIAALLSARPKKLQDAISRIDSAPKNSSIASLEESLRVLHTYVRDPAHREEPMDEIIVPMSQHSLAQENSRHGNQAMILLNWLFQDEILFQALATSLAGTLMRKEDHYIVLGWCKLIRGLVEYEITLKEFEHSGIKDRYSSLLKILSSCITRLTSIVCSGSIVQGEFELPTRLSIAAADCILAITLALTKNHLASDGADDKRKFSDRKVKPIGKSVKVSEDMERKLLLWDNLEQLILLVQRLEAWSRKSRWLHAEGLGRVLKWLEGTKLYNSCVPSEAGSQKLQSGIILLFSCWKHYAPLMHLEDHKSIQLYKELLKQYVSGIQFYADNHSEELPGNIDSGIETLKFFVNCLALLLGRLDGKQFQIAISECGSEISRILISQFQHADDEMIYGAMNILKAVIFSTNNVSTRSALSDTREMDALLPSLLHLLGDRDGAARAVVTLLAEYCSMTADNLCLQKVLKRLSDGSAPQRKNAISVISEYFRISPDHICGMQEVAGYLLDCLADDESEIREQTLNLIPLMDPKLVVPALVVLLYTDADVLSSSVGNAIVSVLKHHNQNFEVLDMLLNCLSNLSQNQDLSKVAGQQKLDLDKALKFISAWSDSVTDWSMLVEPLVDKIFAEPSNAVIVRFLSCVSEHLADAADQIFQRLLMHTRPQSKLNSQKYDIGDRAELENTLFDHLCPLLIIRLLPLRVFDDLNSLIMYGEGRTQDMVYSDITRTECVAGILVDRAFNKYEFEDVRKLAAELCGRIHPQVLFPVIALQLENAAKSSDITRIKSCLFSICTSLVVRGKDSILHPFVPRIVNTIESILSWPSLDGDEVAKAQHGCIDCLALMICTEMQVPKSFRDPTSRKTSVVGAAKMKDSVLDYVFNQLTNRKTEDNQNEGIKTLSFRLCMANVLISACQKITDSAKKLFASSVTPSLFRSLQEITEAEIRAACVQVLFSAVYHLKSEMLPYAPDLLKVALQSLRESSEMEKLAGAKLMASLMASEEMILQTIAGGFIEGKTVLSSMASTDPSPEVRQVCRKLLDCITAL